MRGNRRFLPPVRPARQRWSWEQPHRTRVGPSSHTHPLKAIAERSAGLKGKPGVQGYHRFFSCQRGVRRRPSPALRSSLPGLQGPQARASTGSSTGHPLAGRGPAAIRHDPGAASQVQAVAVSIRSPTLTRWPGLIQCWRPTLEGRGQAGRRGLQPKRPLQGQLGPPGAAVAPACPMPVSSSASPQGHRRNCGWPSPGFFIQDSLKSRIGPIPGAVCLTVARLSTA